MKTFLILLLTTTSAFAQMPPKDLDLGDESMSENTVLHTYHRAFGKKYEALDIRRVPFGKAQALCVKIAAERNSEPWSTLPRYGCNIDNVVVYSYDSRFLAWSQGRPYSENMANHVIRHELAHALFNWPSDHPRACETLCGE